MNYNQGGEKMSKTRSFMEEKFMPVAAKIGGQRHLLALRDGIVMIMPLLIIGAFSMIIAEFPVQAFKDFMANIFGPNWNAFEGVIMNATYGIVALVACFGVANSLVNSYKLDGVPAGILALMSFFVINILSTVTDASNNTTAFWNLSIFDAHTLFTALIIALAVGEIYRFLVQKKFVITLPKTVPPAVSRQFTALLPGIVIVLFFLLVRFLFSLTTWGGFSAFVAAIIRDPLVHVGTSFWGTSVAVIVEHLLWSLGLHGSSIIIFPIFEPLWITASQDNVTAVAQGLVQLPHVVTYTFYENGIWMGGSGATLPVVVYMLLFARSKLLKQVGRLGIAPGIFNINEPVTFGLPIVLNPFLIIPFILSPLVVLVIQYVGTIIGIFPYCTGVMIPWTTPYFISGFLMTGGKIMGLVMNIVCFAAAFFVWLPFIKVWDEKNFAIEKADDEATAQAAAITAIAAKT
jgi:cellobiose PTS system EIIC component